MVLRAQPLGGRVSVRFFGAEGCMPDRLGEFGKGVGCWSVVLSPTKPVHKRVITLGAQKSGRRIGRDETSVYLFPVFH